MTQRKASNRTAPVIAYIIVIAVNFAANALPIAGQQTGDVSDKYASLFTPAGYTFAIWGLIYLALAGYVVFQALPAQRANARLATISPLFSWSCGLNAAWLFAWHYELIGVSLLLMLALLGVLVKIYRDLDVHRDLRPDATRLLVNAPFSLYTAWISVATIANVSAMQAALFWNDTGLSGEEWTMLKLALTGAVGAAIIIVRRDFVFGIVIAWAALGIVSGQLDTPTVSASATTIAAVMILLCLFEFARRASQSLQRGE